ncbi:MULTISPECIES: hypothetical protein [Streptosporangium]|uniref:Secreted protein n=1 Tax=Streptosporangium brasiliense TaxID=47480 RepID=A0ABT9RMR6_9ACTN|nr:hypothetical protein [Streptosporangium brasiliense]MDP9869665.1 hypothetical protein [Streptosporangium brasiliense]
MGFVRVVVPLELWMLLLGAALAVLLVGWLVRLDLARRALKRKEALVLPDSGASHETRENGAPWPVRTYLVSTVSTDGRGSDAQEWALPWPQVRAWAEEISARPDVREAWVTYDDPATRMTTAWTWAGGRQTSKTALPWNWQGRLRARK